MLAALSAAVVLAALGFGVSTLVERLGRDQSVVVITDDSMSPTGTGYSVSVIEGVYRLSYGQTANIDGLDITVTIRPTSVPFTESDPYPIGSFPTEPEDRQLRSRLRSQYIITNTGSEPQMVDLRRFVALGEDGNRYSLMAQALELAPGGTLSGRLDFYVDNGAAANTVAYTADYGADNLAVWGPEAITEGALFPILVEGKWGFIDSTGTIKIEPQFAGIRRLDGEGGLIGFCEGLCAVQATESGPWGYIDTSGRMIIEPQFDLAQWFSEGLAVVRSADRWYFIDKSGTTMLGPFSGAFGFSGGLATVLDGESRTGSIDKSGDWVPEVEGPGGVRLSISSGFFEGLAVAYTVDGGEAAPASLAGYVDASGVLVIKPQFNVAGEFSDGLAAVGIGENDDAMKYGYIDKTGAWVVQPQFWSADPFSEGLARVAVKVEDGVKIGFIDKTGAWAVEPRFDDAHSFSEGLAIVWENDQCGYIDKAGTVVIPIDYQIAGFDFSGGAARVGGGFDGSPSYIDKTGRVIWQGE